MPRIVTSLDELRSSGRMCPEGWSTLLGGLGKTKADDAPLDVLECLPICGHRDTLWHLPNWPALDEACRSLALSYARAVAHFAKEPAVPVILDRCEGFLRGQLPWQQVVEAVPLGYRDIAQYDCHSWELLSGPDEAALYASVLTTFPDGCLSPFLVAHAAEQAEGLSSSTGRERAERRHHDLLEAFLRE